MVVMRLRGEENGGWLFQKHVNGVVCKLDGKIFGSVFDHLNAKISLMLPRLSSSNIRRVLEESVLIKLGMKRLGVPKLGVVGRVEVKLSCCCS
jgi:hypothetical protein